MLPPLLLETLLDTVPRPVAALVFLNEVRPFVLLFEEDFEADFDALPAVDPFPFDLDFEIFLEEVELPFDRPADLPCL